MQGAAEMRIGSLRCRIRSRPPRYAEMLSDVFRTDLEPCSSPAKHTDLDVAIREEAASAPSPTDSLTVRPVADGWEISTDPLVCRMREAGAGHAVELVVRLPGMADSDLAYHFWIVSNHLLLLLEGIVLHAAAVELDGGVDLFCGPSSAGKSTLAIRLAQSGARILAEDHVLARRDGGTFRVSGCSSRLRVAADTEAYLLPGRLASIPATLVGGRPRKELEADRFFSAEPYVDRSPRRLFLLSPGEVLSVEPASGKEALLHLIETSKEMLRLSSRADQVAFLDLLADLATAVPAYRLRRGRLQQLDRLPEVLRELAPESAA